MKRELTCLHRRGIAHNDDRARERVIIMRHVPPYNYNMYRASVYADEKVCYLSAINETSGEKLSTEEPHCTSYVLYQWRSHRVCQVCTGIPCKTGGNWYT